MERFNFRILILFWLFVVASCQIQDEKFDKTAWNKRTDMFYDNRNKMIDDLMENHLQKGMTLKSVIEMLGNHDNYSDLDSNTIGYEIYVDYGWDIDPVETKTLLIEFSKDSTITGFRLKHWKK